MNTRKVSAEQLNAISEKVPSWIVRYWNVKYLFIVWNMSRTVATVTSYDDSSNVSKRVFRELGELVDTFCKV